MASKNAEPSIRDLDHNFAELHPLYSVAWQDSCAGNTETWAYMFASRGAQGWVSSGLNHSPPPLAVTSADASTSIAG